MASDMAVELAAAGTCVSSSCRPSLRGQRTQQRRGVRLVARHPTPGSSSPATVSSEAPGRGLRPAERRAGPLGRWLPGVTRRQPCRVLPSESTPPTEPASAKTANPTGHEGSKTTTVHKCSYARSWLPGASSWVPHVGRKYTAENSQVRVCRGAGQLYPSWQGRVRQGFGAGPSWCRFLQGGDTPLPDSGAQQGSWGFRPLDGRRGRTVTRRPCWRSRCGRTARASRAFASVRRSSDWAARCLPSPGPAPSPPAASAR